MAIFQRLKKTFLPSAEEGARRRLAAFGTTSKKPAVAAALIAGASVLPLGRIARGAGAVFKGTRALGTGVASTAAGVATKKTFGQVARGAYERALGNPFGGGVKSFFGRIAGRAVGAPLFATGAAFAKSAITGEDVNLSKDALVKGSIGFALGGPVGYAVGTGFGLVDLGTDKVSDIVKEINMPNVPSPQDFGEDIGELLRETGSGVAEFSQGLGSGLSGNSFIAPQVSYGIAGPSVSVDAGRGGIPPELWLLLVSLLGVAGARAYLKRRKKKKKAKKRKK